MTKCYSTASNSVCLGVKVLEVKKLTYQDVKTTKRTAIARGHSNRKQGRKGHRHTMSIAGCIRTRLA